ncbi:PRD domain-containing protein [Tetragenococcus halophilus]|uniref:PRD domain-containing protein n=1 Tax=Tetragenococcus halophilus TaxID=51669 RepID=UPI002A9EAE45|nr:hypothetical protein TEHSL10_22680 [Tetragenococcus halophilus]
MIRQKLDVLLNSHTIDEETFNYVSDVLYYLLEEQIIQEEDQADVFLTHLAMADARRKGGEPVDELDPAILDEIKNDSNYTHSVELWESLKRIADKRFDESELNYFYLHIINMLREKE